jgi:hypothetical protein
MGIHSSVAGGRADRHRTRLGAIKLPMTYFVVGTLLFVALGLDVSFRFTARRRAQRAADEAALAAARKLAATAPVPPTSDETGAAAALRQSAFQAAVDAVATRQRQPDRAGLCFPQGGVEFGRWETTSAGDDEFTFDVPARFNAVRVRLGPSSNGKRRQASFFSSPLSIGETCVAAEATAVFCDNVRGFRVEGEENECSLMPFALHVNVWRAWLDGVGQDDWTCHAKKDIVSAGADGIREFRVPADEDGCGIVEIGAAADSTANLLRQIRYGLTRADLASHGGEIALHETDGTLVVNGHTKITIGMNSALKSIGGQPRTVMLYRDASRRGDRTRLTIVGFVGVRLVDFSMDGNDPFLQFQPAVVLDPMALAGHGERHSWYVRQPARLLP